MLSHIRLLIYTLMDFDSVPGPRLHDLLLVWVLLAVAPRYEQGNLERVYQGD